jgi:hypothetical protein
VFSSFFSFIKLPYEFLPPCKARFRGAGVSPAFFLNVQREIKPAGKMPPLQNANPAQSLFHAP